MDAAFKKPLPKGGEAKEEVKEEVKVEAPLVKLSDSQMSEALTAFTKLLDIQGTGEKQDLLGEVSGEGRKLQLQVAGIKLPRESQAQVVKFKLPHHHTPDSRDVCLIVKDIEKGIKPDHDDTVRHYEALLAEKGVKGVTKVMALRELKVEYKTFESKTALCHLYDHFLADARIIRLLPQFLGKAFYKRKKFPMQVDLTSSSLSSELSRALHTVSLPLKHAGSSATVTIGLSTAAGEELSANLATVVRGLETKYPGGWRNIRSLHLLSGTCSLPLYMSLRSTQEVGMVQGTDRKRKAVVSDELSTVVGATVTVTPTGGVRVKRTKDPMWMEDDDMQEVTNEVAEVDGKNKDDVKEVKKAKKEKKQKKDEAEKEDEDSEDEMEDKELAYMQKVADEEEEMEKNLEASEEKLKEKLDKAKEGEDEEEDEVDDDAEAENLLSDGEDSDSEDELIMKKTQDDDDDEATPAKKKKLSKKKAAAKAKSPKEKPATKKSQKQKKFVDQKKKAKLSGKK